MALLAGIALLAWWMLWVWGSSPQGHMVLHGHGVAAMARQEPLRFALGFVFGWTLMTAAMMLPASMPLLSLFHRMVRGRATGLGLVAVVICGYLAVWLLAGAALHVVYRLVHAAAGQLHLPVAASWFTAAGILTIAGLFQFSSLKRVCLTKCRSPLSFLVAHWKGGNEWLQSARLGAAHGLFCVGCCWALMLLMFLTGVGSVAGMLLLGLLMAAEKNFAWGRRISAPLGVLLLTGAATSAAAGLGHITINVPIFR